MGVRAGRNYVDTGTLHGYRAAIRLLEHPDQAALEPEGARPAAVSSPDSTVSSRD
jgi:hypothetical protein